MRIGYSWSTVTGDPCPTCNQNVVTKNKRLWLFGIPLGKGFTTVSCGCPKEGKAAAPPAST
ncbi:MAG: hypothetical protein H6708_08720 [Kofleriaceae bacterium]|nr:hypothetical protein [Myxococcales bacterium]MCB9560480.1 hypothetical protein [Kofleriaceae bacterium]